MRAILSSSDEHAKALTGFRPVEASVSGDVPCRRRFEKAQGFAEIVSA
jgi:hypothetical protein